MKHFDQGTYWIDRVSGKMGLGAVGQRSLGAEYNRWIYQRRVDALNELCRESIKTNEDTRVLDLGCGAGFYEVYWQSLGVKHLTGVDISAQNVAAIQQKFPNYRFVQADLTEFAGSLDGRYDVVTLFDVIYHLVDDAAANRALGIASAHLAENGRLLLFDQLVKQDYNLRQHVKFRGRENFARMLHSQGLEIEKEIPLFVLLVPPIYGIRPVDYLVAGMYYVAGLLFRAVPQIGFLAGRGAYAMDAALLRRRTFTQNHSLYVIRQAR